jgi:hypothetical protein
MGHVRAHDGGDDRDARELKMPDGKQRHGRVSAVILLIDVINHFEFPDGDRILRRLARAIAPSVVRLKRRAREAGSHDLRQQ